MSQIGRDPQDHSHHVDALYSMDTNRDLAIYGISTPRELSAVSVYTLYKSAIEAEIYAALQITEDFYHTAT